MSYRKITVNGIDYQYTVGETHVKIRGIGTWLKEDIGEIVRTKYGCGCGCYPDEEEVYTKNDFTNSDAKEEFPLNEKVRVRPEHIANLIKKITQLSNQ